MSEYSALFMQATQFLTSHAQYDYERLHAFLRALCPELPDLDELVMENLIVYRGIPCSDDEMAWTFRQLILHSVTTLSELGHIHNVTPTQARRVAQASRFSTRRAGGVRLYCMLPSPKSSGVQS